MCLLLVDDTCVGRGCSLSLPSFPFDESPPHCLRSSLHRSSSTALSFSLSVSDVERANVVATVVSTRRVRVVRSLLFTRAVGRGLAHSPGGAAVAAVAAVSSDDGDDGDDVGSLWRGGFCSPALRDRANKGGGVGGLISPFLRIFATALTLTKGS